MMEKAQEKQYEVQDRWPLHGGIASLRPACIAEFQYQPRQLREILFQKLKTKPKINDQN